MGITVDRRIKLSAMRSRERFAAIKELEFTQPELYKMLKDLFEKQDLEELRELLLSEIGNMQARLWGVLGLQKQLHPGDLRLLVKKLHTKTYDQTFRDAGPEKSVRRTRERIEALLELCHGDEALLLREYAKALNYYFPVPAWSRHYVWNPTLIVRKLKSGKVRRTIRHGMSFRSRLNESDPRMPAI